METEWWEVIQDLLLLQLILLLFYLLLLRLICICIWGEEVPPGDDKWRI